MPPGQNSAKLHHLATSGLLLLSPKLTSPLGTTWLFLGRAFALNDATEREIFDAFRLLRDSQRDWRQSASDQAKAEGFLEQKSSSVEEFHSKVNVTHKCPVFVGFRVFRISEKSIKNL